MGWSVEYISYSCKAASTAFTNLGGFWFAVVSVQKMDYVTYLTVFDRLFDVPKERKNASYKA